MHFDLVSNFEYKFYVSASEIIFGIDQYAKNLMQIKEKNDSRSDIFCKSCEATRVVTVCNQIHLVEKRRFLHFHSNKKYFPFNRGRNCENGGGGARDPNRGLMTGNTAEIYICTIL